jgi:hypothetical protein
VKKKKLEQLTKSGRFWSLFPVALIVTMFVGLGSMAYVAVDDPSFAIEKDYYRKAVGWDETRAQAAENARLGWKIELSTEPHGKELRVVARVKDARGASIPGATVAVEAFANARASRIVSTRLSSEADASYRGGMALTQAGLWEFRFSVESEGQRFTEVLRQEVRAGDAS